jgi:hypothetical protein
MTTIIFKDCYKVNGTFSFGWEKKEVKRKKRNETESRNYGKIDKN